MTDMGDRALLSTQRTLKMDSVDTPNLPTPSSPPPPVAHAGQNKLAVHPQPEGILGDEDDGCSLLAAAPVKSEQMHHVLSAAASYSAAPPQTCNNVPLTKLPEGLTQNLRPVGMVYGELVYDVPADVIPLISAAELQTRNTVLVTKLPEGLTQNLQPVGVVKGELVYEIPPDSFPLSDSAAPPPSQNKEKSEEPKREDKQEYIKMPLNAFMLFLKAQRVKVADELGVTKSAVLNTVLGHRWRMLSEEEKAQYYEEARKEKQLHEQRYPDWSPCTGKKKKKEKPKRHKKKPSPSVK